MTSNIDSIRIVRYDNFVKIDETLVDSKVLKEFAFAPAQEKERNPKFSKVKQFLMKI